MKKLHYLPLLLITACAGMSRSCAGCNAERFGADWIVAQYVLDGSVMRCWKLPRTSVANEAGSDGIYWQDLAGHLVHISGWYNRVQVSGGDWAGAAKALGVDLSKCEQ